MRCKTCKGKGYIEREFKRSANEKVQIEKDICESCNGQGKITKHNRGGKDKGFDWSID